MSLDGRHHLQESHFHKMRITGHLVVDHLGSILAKTPNQAEWNVDRRMEELEGMPGPVRRLLDHQLQATSFSKCITWTHNCWQGRDVQLAVYKCILDALHIVGGNILDGLEEFLVAFFAPVGWNER